MPDEPHRGATMPIISEAGTIGRDDEAVIRLAEERLTVGKRIAAGDTIRVTTRTETRDEAVEVTLDHAEVDVERVPVGRPIDAAPPVRHEGATMVVPVVEERLIITKQLYLVEELRISQRTTQETVKTSVPLRRQQAVVERTGTAGETLPELPGKPASD